MSLAAIYLKQRPLACFTFFLKKAKAYSAVLAGLMYIDLELSDTRGSNDLALLPLKNLFCVTCCVLEDKESSFGNCSRGVVSSQGLCRLITESLALLQACR